MTTTRTLGRRVLAIRIAADLTQVQVAKRGGLTQGQISAIETGGRVTATGPTLVRLARGLGCTVDELVE